MAFTAQNLLSDALAKQRIGNLNISLDSWTDTAIPVITAGSWLTCAGTVYYNGADITIDGDGVLAAGANSTLYYYHFDSVDLDVICTSSAPTWLDDKAEWGQTLGGHYCRCLGSVWKNSGGTYEQKSIWYGRDFGILASGMTVAIGANADRTIRLATNCRILWDESEDIINIDKGITIPFANTTGAGILLKSITTATSPGPDFNILRPVSCYLTRTSGVTTAINGRYNSTIYTAGSRTSAGSEVVHLWPGTYYMYQDGAGGSGTLHAYAAWGLDTLSADKICT